MTSLSRPVQRVTEHRYDAIAISLHWLIAMALPALIVMGLYMTALPFSPQRLKLYNWHKWAGMLALAVMLLRLGWRAAHRPPSALPMPAWQASAAHLAHAGLYLLAIAAPAAGYLYSCAAGFPVVLFGRWPLPDPLGASQELAAILKPLHHWLAYALGMLAALHVTAVAKHERILARMGAGAKNTGSIS